MWRGCAAPHTGRGAALERAECQPTAPGLSPPWHFPGVHAKRSSRWPTPPARRTARAPAKCRDDLRCSETLFRCFREDGDSFLECPVPCATARPPGEGARSQPTAHRDRQPAGASLASWRATMLPPDPRNRVHTLHSPSPPVYKQGQATSDHQP